MPVICCIDGNCCIGPAAAAADEEEEDEEGGPDGNGPQLPGLPFRGGVVTMPEPGVCGVAGRIGVHGPIPTWH